MSINKKLLIEGSPLTTDDGTATPVFLPGRAGRPPPPNHPLSSICVCIYLYKTLYSQFGNTKIFTKHIFPPQVIGCETCEEGIHRAWTPSQAVCADHAWPLLQWTLNSVLSACGNDSERIRPPSGQGNLEEEKTDTNHPCLRTVSIGM